MFDWQRHTQENSDVRHYTEILEFIDLRARAFETVLHEVQKCNSQTMQSRASTPGQDGLCGKRRYNLHNVRCCEAPLVHVQEI